MTVTEREFQALKDSIIGNQEVIVKMLELRKEYFDNKFDEICRSIKEMKGHCSHTQDQCSIVFREHDKRIDINTNEITKIKTVGSVIVFIWGSLVAVVSHMWSKM